SAASASMAGEPRIGIKGIGKQRHGALLRGTPCITQWSCQFFSLKPSDACAVLHPPCSTRVPGAATAHCGCAGPPAACPPNALSVPENFVEFQHVSVGVPNEADAAPTAAHRYRAFTDWDALALQPC